MRLPRVLGAAAVVAVTLVAAGCSGSSMVTRAEYQANVVQARDRVDFALAQITVGRGTVEQLIDRMHEAAIRIDNAADDLDDAGVADGFEDETATLVAALHSLAAGIDGTASDAEQPEFQGILTSTNSLQFPGWTKTNRVLAQLKQQGIDVGPIGSH